MTIGLPYGRELLRGELPDERVLALAENRLETYVPEKSEEALIREAMENPIGSAKLEELARGKERVVIIASDHTRPVPSKRIVPPMLEAIRRGNPSAKITILIATGCHRGTTREELVKKFGPEIVETESIVVHDCANEENLVTLGTLPSGGRLRINRLAAEADLLVSEGFIEPHFFAGFSGGRKSVLPGVAAQETVYWNHNAVFIKDPYSRAGVLADNPIHRDMLYAARKANLAFICNVVINGAHRVLGAFAGDCDAAHLAGAKFLENLCRVELPQADIVITTNNGYPLDQNIYQAVKGMSTAETICREGGVIIMAAACEDGHGGEEFARTFREDGSAGEILKRIEAVSAAQTVADQWQSQIFARVLKKCRVVLISKADPDLVRSLRMYPANHLSGALEQADRLLGRKGSITVIPQGVSTIVTCGET